jgi:hypothetical protein
VGFSRQQPGFPVSAAAHVGLLAAALIAFSQSPKFEDAQETVPVEVVSDQALNQITKGEKSARAVKPAQRAEKIAPQPETHPHPPQAEAKRDIPTPPPPLKRLADEPSEDDTPQKQAKETPTPPKRIAALPAPTPEPPARPAPAPKAAPTPPPKPQAKAAPEPEKIEPDDAEVTRPKPPVKPKLEKAQEETPPQPKTPPKPPESPKAKEAPRLKTDEVAKLLQQKKTQARADKSGDASEDKEASAEKPVKSEKSGAGARPKSGDETAPKSKFNAANIANLLSREAPQQRASTGTERTQLASLGAPNASAAKMSPSLQGKIDSYTVEHYRRCWVSALSMNALNYVPRVEFRLTRTGALEGSPRLLNPSSDPVEKARGEQALASVRRCSPMPIPAEFSPYYDYWRVTELDMKEDM